MGPLPLLLCGVVIVTAAILLLRVHAFLALLAAAVVVAALTPADAVFRATLGTRLAKVEGVTNGGEQVRVELSRGLETDELLALPRLSVDAEPVEVERYESSNPKPAAAAAGGEMLLRSSMAVPKVGDYLVDAAAYAAAVDAAESTAVERITGALGSTVGKLGVLIALASILGRCLLASGAAARIVRGIQDAFGERRSAPALVLSSFVLAIPVYFDTVFFLMLPIARAMADRTRRDYLKYVLAIVVGGTLAHSLVPPTPGPLLVSRELGVSVAAMFVGGLCVGAFGVAAGYAYLLWANRRFTWMSAPPSEATGGRDTPAGGGPEEADQPSLPWAVAPTLLPIVLLGFAAVWALRAADPSPPAWRTALDRFAAAVSDPNVALAAGAVLALLVYISVAKRRGEKAKDLVQTALAEAGVVILITGAGGAFGAVMQQTGIAAYVGDSFPSVTTGTSLLVAAFLATAAIRIAQGSATVAMITAVGIFGPVAAAADLPYHPVYLALAIGCGSKPLPWMNDSGFWVVGRMSGMSDGQTFKSFSVLLTIMGLAAFAATVAFSILLPFHR